MMFSDAAIVQSIHVSQKSKVASTAEMTVMKSQTSLKDLQQAIVNI
jgi:hypothetical protein